MAAGEDFDFGGARHTFKSGKTDKSHLGGGAERIPNPESQSDV